MKVIFVILNYKTYQETIKLTDMLVKDGLEDKFVLIVDNLSPNESYQVLSSKYSNTDCVEVVLSPENGGYAKGNNYGLRYAKKYNPLYVCIINNDVQFSVRMIDSLCDWYEKLCRVAFIAPKQKLPNGEDATFKTMDVPTLKTDLSLYNPFSTRRHYYVENTEIKGVNKIGIIPGAFIFTNYALFERLGFFEESTFLFCEERFIAKKAEMAGLNNYIILGEIYLHNHSTTISNEASEKRQRRLIREGRCLYYKKYSRHPFLSVAVIKMADLFYEIYLKLFGMARKIKRMIL